MKPGLRVWIEPYAKRMNSVKSMKRMRGKQNKRRYILGILAALLLQGIGVMAVYAVLDGEEEETVTSVNVMDSDIEMSTMVIGSHLIHINGLTDQLYAVAMVSANEFNQNQIYYKSELAEGGWFEISEAVSIADISTAGTPVDKSVIEALEFTHKTGSDGVTIDLRTEEEVSIFDIPNPYVLEGLEELQPLVRQYDVLQAKEEYTDSDEEYLDMIKGFFEEDVQDDDTDALDETLASLETYKRGLTTREKPSDWKEKTDDIMASVDAERRIIVLKKLEHLLDVLDHKAQGLAYEEEETEGGEGSEGSDEGSDGGGDGGSDGGSEAVEANPELEVNTDIVAAIGQCIQNVQASILAYQAKCISDNGETVTSQAEYRYSMELIECAKNEDTEGCDGNMQKLCDLQNIIGDMIANQIRELDTLTAELIQEAYRKYITDISAGVSEDYKNALASGSAQAVLVQYLKQQKTVTNADRLEYQMFLEAAFKRMENKAAQAYVLQLIDGIPAMHQSVRSDAAAAYLKETIEEHLEWLRSSYSALVKSGADSTEMEKLEQEKADLEKKYLDALDREDYAEVNRLRALLEAKQKDLDRLLESLLKILNSSNSSEADKAGAKAQMGESNTAALLNDMTSELTSDIRSGTATEEDLKNQLAALAAVATLNPNAGSLALEEVQKALDQATGLDQQLAASLEEALANARDAVETAAEAELSGETLAALLKDILERLFGTDFDNMTSAQQAAAILAMEWYGQKQESKVALKQAGELALQAAYQGNPFLYHKYKLKTPYMSLQALGQTLGYRYIFDDVHVEVTLQKGTKYYLFTSGSRKYERTGGKKKKLKVAPKRMETLYIHGKDCEKIFSTKAEYIEKASYGVVGTPTVETQAKEIYERLLKGG